jgi:hypothetical protein
VSTAQNIMLFFLPFYINNLMLSVLVPFRSIIKFAYIAKYYCVFFFLYRDLKKRISNDDFFFTE